MKTAFVNCHVVDVVNASIIDNCTVMTESGRITAVSPHLDTECAAVIDLAGCYLSPGLFNMHVHTTLDARSQQFSTEDDLVNLVLVTLENLADYIRGGATFVRDVGSFDFIFQLKEEVDSGRIKMAPDMQLSGRAICQTGGTMWYSAGYEADGIDECRKAARRMIRLGADWLKLMGTGGVVTRHSKPDAVQLSLEEMKAVIDEGHKVGIKSSVHVQNDAGARMAIMAGADCLEHGFDLSDETIELMLERGTWLCPTLSAPYCVSVRSSDQTYRDKAKAALERAYQSFTKAYRAGVPCVVSNDSGTPSCYHRDTAMELVLMVEQCGLTPAEAFYLGTMNGARLCGVEQDLGSVEAGKKAHFAVFPDNPFADIRHAMSNVMTVKNGEVVWSSPDLQFTTRHARAWDDLQKVTR